MATISGVFVYTNLNSPQPKFNANEGDEYKVSLVISEKDAKAWKKQWRKQAAKEVDTEEFEERFGIAPPFTKQEEQFVITFRQNAQIKDKKTKQTIPLPDQMRVKALLNTGRKNGAGKPILEEITETKLVGNGSKGVVLYRETSNDYGSFAKAVAIRVDSLIEYSSGPSYDELGDIEESSGEPDFDDEPPFDTEDDEGDEDSSDDDLY